MGPEFLDDRNEVEKIVDDKFAFTNFDNKNMKNCEENFTHACKSKKEFIDQIWKRQKVIAESFVKHKNEIHDAEDPNILQDGSDILDIRNWNINAFNPKSSANREDKEFIH